MIARCPNNPEHETFYTSAHVVQIWKVNEHGEWIETLDDCEIVTGYPDPGCFWYCFECGTENRVRAELKQE